MQTAALVWLKQVARLPLQVAIHLRSIALMPLITRVEGSRVKQADVVLAGLINLCRSPPFARQGTRLVLRFISSLIVYMYKGPLHLIKALHLAHPDRLFDERHHGIIGDQTLTRLDRGTCNQYNFTGALITSTHPVLKLQGDVMRLPYAHVCRHDHLNLRRTTALLNGSRR